MRWQSLRQWLTSLQNASFDPLDSLAQGSGVTSKKEINDVKAQAALEVRRTFEVRQDGQIKTLTR